MINQQSQGLIKQQVQNQRKVNFKYSQHSMGRTCKHCGFALMEQDAFCPACHYPTIHNRCTFCGTQMLPDDIFCPECGVSKGGIRCPRCKTVNFKGFCVNCHQPLTEEAYEEYQKAQADPKVQQMKKLMEEIAQLEVDLDIAEPDEEEELQQQESQETGLQNQEQQQELLFSDEELQDMIEPDECEIPLQPLPETKITPCPPKTQEERRKKKEVYHEKVASLNEIYKEFSPDPDSTPEMQRNYYSARMVKIKTTTRQRVCTGWICNYCGYHHRVPEDCCKPQLGGTYVYRDKVIETETWTSTM